MRPFAKGPRKRAIELIHGALGHPDEKIVEVDGGASAASGQRYDFIATDSALYVYNPRFPDQTVRFTYRHLANVVARDPRHPGYFEFTDRRSGARFGFDDVTLSKGVLPRYVQDASERHDTSEE